MQRNERVEKKKVLLDGVEIAGLVAVRGIRREEPTVEVPGFKKITTARSGIKKLNPFTLVYKLTNGTNTSTVINNWVLDNETKDVTIIRTDAHGVEFERKLYLGCEAYTLEEPDYDASSPAYAQITIEVTPYDVQVVE